MSLRSFLSFLKDQRSEAEKVQEQNQRFRKLFSLPEDENLLTDCACALLRSILLQGRLYISENYLCFFSNILGHKSSEVIPIQDVVRVEKATTVFIPNAIEIHTEEAKFFFGSFLNRNKIYDLVSTIVTRSLDERAQQREDILEKAIRGNPLHRRLGPLTTSAGESPDFGSDDDSSRPTTPEGTQEASSSTPVVPVIPSPASSSPRHVGRPLSGRKSVGALREKRKEKFHKLFNLPVKEDLLGDFSCALYRSIMLVGRMYISASYVCFHADVLGFKTVEVIPFKDLLSLSKTSKVVTLQGTIAITTRRKRSFVFVSFADRDKVFIMMEELWTLYRQRSSLSPRAVQGEEVDTPVPVDESSKAVRARKLQKEFDLNPQEELLDDYACALLRSILMQGRMYVFHDHVCFSANIFGFRTREKIAFSDIIGIEESKTALVFPNAVEIITRAGMFFFGSFVFRDKALKVLEQRWYEVMDVMKEEGNPLHPPVLVAPPTTETEVDPEALRKDRETEYHDLFGGIAPAMGSLVQDAPCSLYRGVLADGRLYLDKSYLCFFTDILNMEGKEVIAFASVTAIVKEDDVQEDADGFADGADPPTVQCIVVTTDDAEKYAFANFVDRERIFKVMEHLWKNALDHTADDIPEPEGIGYDPLLASEVANEEDALSEAYEGDAFDQNPAPIVVIVNPKAGSLDGKRLLAKLRCNPYTLEVFDLTAGHIDGIQKYSDVRDLRVIVAGGDGTACWAMDLLDENGFGDALVSLLPVGTGNDLARALGWGAEATATNVTRIIERVRRAKPIMLDRWISTITCIDPETKEATGDPRRIIFQNYLSIGFDAQVSLDFHTFRNANPRLCSTRFSNKQWYFNFGVAPVIGVTPLHHMSHHIRVEIDGEPVEIPEGIRAFTIVNIRSYASGMNVWGKVKKKDRDKFVPQEIDDGLFEVLGIRGPLHFVAIRLQMQGHAIRLGQGRSAKVSWLSSHQLAMQADGEPWMQDPCEITIHHHRKVNMLVPHKVYEKMREKRERREKGENK
eukprot:TRINITY_DN19310_c0_g1_i1.p1 TRINITY_DN19310_c0_g1~~TRINITY_DN19310_c0_g1_i1.p1  ORF type:complete len:1035 (+),score=233.77 TRINITY_DN19310_c0_g1_i1:37-3105(+)